MDVVNNEIKRLKGEEVLDLVPEFDVVKVRLKVRQSLSGQAKETLGVES